MTDSIFVRTMIGLAALGSLILTAGWLLTIIDIFVDLGPYMIGILMMGIGVILMFPLFAFFVAHRQ